MLTCCCCSHGGPAPAPSVLQLLACQLLKFSCFPTCRRACGPLAGGRPLVRGARRPASLPAGACFACSFLSALGIVRLLPSKSASWCCLSWSCLLLHWPELRVTVTPCLHLCCLPPCPATSHPTYPQDPTMLSLGIGASNQKVVGSDLPAPQINDTSEQLCLRLWCSVALFCHLFRCAGRTAQHMPHQQLAGIGCGISLVLKAADRTTIPRFIHHRRAAPAHRRAAATHKHQCGSDLRRLLRQVRQMLLCLEVELVRLGNVGMVWPSGSHGLGVQLSCRSPSISPLHCMQLGALQHLQRRAVPDDQLGRPARGLSLRECLLPCFYHR